MIKLVAEIGINHNADMDIVCKLIKAASISGFDFVKFQKRDPEITTPEHMKNVIRKTPWGEMTYLDYKKKIELSKVDYEIISDVCNKENIGWFASVWDIESARFFVDTVPNHLVKIPSAKITDIDLLLFCRDNFDTVIISTGMSTENEINRAITIGSPDVVFHSVASYPTLPEDTNLNYINELQRKYSNLEIGYSGHEEGIDFAVSCVALGVSWIEKHITLDRRMWGSDQGISIEPDEMYALSKRVRILEKGFVNDMKDRVVLPCEQSKKEQLRG